MRLVVKKSDREKIHSCCGRQPIVGACIDFADEYVPAFDIYCPVCERVVCAPSFIEAREKWYQAVMLDECKDYLAHTFCPEVSE